MGWAWFAAWKWVLGAPWGESGALLLVISDFQVGQGGVVAHRIAVHDEGQPVVVVLGQVIELVDHELIKDRTEGAGSGFSLQGTIGDFLEGIGGEFQISPLDSEEVLELANECVLGLGEILPERLPKKI